jgi:hypothetical protein
MRCKSRVNVKGCAGPAQRTLADAAAVAA